VFYGGVNKMENAVTFTLSEIKKHDPCTDGWKKLTKSLGGVRGYGLNTPITVEQIIKSNGIDDALWALRTLGEEHRSWLRHYAVDCAESVEHFMKDERSKQVLIVARNYANGEATDVELHAAAAAAAAAAWDAAAAVAWHAAWHAASAAARSAAWTTARDSAAYAELLIEYCRTGERVMNAQDIIKKHMEK
jgi:hypothetical protein